MIPHGQLEPVLDCGQLAQAPLLPEMNNLPVKVLVVRQVVGSFPVVGLKCVVYPFAGSHSAGLSAPAIR